MFPAETSLDEMDLNLLLTKMQITTTTTTTTTTPVREDTLKIIHQFRPLQLRARETAQGTIQLLKHQTLLQGGEGKDLQ